MPRDLDALLGDASVADQELVVAEGDLVMTEHTERWTFHTGEVIDHSFVSVTELRDGKICRWHDYSNIPNITDNAPAWWIESIMKAATQG